MSWIKLTNFYGDAPIMTRPEHILLVSKEPLADVTTVVIVNQLQKITLSVKETVDEVNAILRKAGEQFTA